MGSLADNLALKIVLLSLVNRTPEEARSTLEARKNSQKDEQTNRFLPLNSEISVTQQLAFISAYSDDAYHVMAICVEEVTERRIIFRFAANKGVHHDFNGGLRGIARILEDEAHSVNQPKNSHALLHAVISLNRKRILCRLRSRHARSSRKTRGKPSLLSRLQKAQTLLGKSRVSASTLQGLSRNIAHVQRHFDQLEEMGYDDALSRRSDSCLLSLVNGMNDLLRFEQALRRVPYQPGSWEREATAALIDRVWKSGHYVDACSELLKAARRYTIFSNIDVEFVNLQSSSITVSAPDAAAEGVAAGELLTRVSNLLGQRERHIKEDVKRTLASNSRVHAEVQLVLFYEQESRPRPPRVICSSKSACYLCHLLFATQGKYIIPSTHGRLYTGWKWPEQGLQELLPKFIDHVELKLQESVNRRAARRPDPVESIVHLLPVITPSNRSDISAVSQAPDRIEVMSTRNSNATNQGSTPDSPTAPARVATLSDNNTPKMWPAAETTKVQPHEDTHYTDNIRHGLESNRLLRRDDTPDIIRLTRGTVMIHAFTEDNRTLCMITRGLRIHWECDISTFEDDGSTGPLARKEFQVRVEWLDTKVTKESGEQPVDLVGDWEEELLPNGTLFTANGLLLQRGSTLVRLRAIST